MVLGGKGGGGFEGRWATGIDMTMQERYQVEAAGRIPVQIPPDYEE